MLTDQKANRLINSTSPYLLQHAYNPVDWFEWGAEALEKARQEDKPILVSIGYSSCHWCHVMERECFEKEHVARVMNDLFVCIKVDREERPDIDHIYMDAVHALGIQGGWPLNVFLTPDQKPFFGGTYFNEDTWLQVLRNISKAFAANRDQIEDTAEELRLHLLRSEVKQFMQVPHNSALDQDLEEIYSKLSSRFDKEWGGMDKAPKFIMPTVWLLLLRYYRISKKDEALQHLILTLKRIGMGGIYDQVGGGFARYSVDAYWFVPHFEKMLYDNAQLLSLYSEAYALTKDEEFKTIVYETFEWLQREMTSYDGGFYSALDADSDGVEGKYYIWDKKEFEKITGRDGEALSAYYSLQHKGNWEHNLNILIRGKDDDSFLKDMQMSKEELRQALKRNKKELLRERNTRVKPGLDEKIITAWNAMTIIGLIDAYKAFGDQRFHKAALLNMRFLENELMEGNTVYRSFKDKRSSVKGFLDDYAYLIQAQIKLYQVTFDEYWIRRAENFMHHVLEQFYDQEEKFFFYTPRDGEPLLTRKKEIFDNVIPSSNSVMSQNLYHLGILLDKQEWKTLGESMTHGLSHLIKSEPGFMSNWGISFLEMKKGLAEVVFVGPNALLFLLQFLEQYNPFTLTMGTTTKSQLPLIEGKVTNDQHTTIYVCYNKTCKKPVQSVEEAVAQLS